MSKIKEQHKKLHSAEQILRAELAEKRTVLKGLRKVGVIMLYRYCLTQNISKTFFRNSRSHESHGML